MNDKILSFDFTTTNFIFIEFFETRLSKYLTVLKINELLIFHVVDMQKYYLL